VSDGWTPGMPNAIDNRRMREAERIARVQGKEARRDRLRDIPLHDRPHVRDLVIQIFEERRNG